MSSTTTMGIPYPASTDNVQIWTHFANLAAAVDVLFNLPDDEETHSSAAITVTSTSFAVLPSPGPVTRSFTNPSSDYDLLVDVSYSAWLAASANDVRVALAASGGLTITPGSYGTGGAVAHSDDLETAGADSVQCYACIPVTIPAGAAAVTFALHGMRSSAAGTQTVSYATLRVRPRRFLVP